MSTRLEMYKAFLSLAKTQRTLAGRYRQWAREEQAKGNAERFNRYRAEAQRLFRDAHYHLNKARDNSNAHY